VLYLRRRLHIYTKGQIYTFYIHIIRCLKVSDDGKVEFARSIEWLSNYPYLNPSNAVNEFKLLLCINQGDSFRSPGVIATSKS
jgi:hypothetical protein